MLERIHLAIVQEVDRQGSLTAAAGALHLTQSALSHAVRKLEEQLGTALWIREGRSLRPTQAGEYLLAVANPSSSRPRSGCASLPAASAAPCASAWSATPATSGC